MAGIVIIRNNMNVCVQILGSQRLRELALALDVAELGRFVFDALGALGVLSHRRMLRDASAAFRRCAPTWTCPHTRP